MLEKNFMRPVSNNIVICENELENKIKNDKNIKGIENNLEN